MPFGPIEMVVIKFPGNKFTGEITPALLELTDNGIIRVVDILIATKDDSGQVEMVSVSDLDDSGYAPFIEDMTELLSEEDVRIIGGSLENNSTAAMMLFENTWATRFVEAVRNAEGELVMNERIPRAVIEQMLADTSEEERAAKRA